MYLHESIESVRPSRLTRLPAVIALDDKELPQPLNSYLA